MRSGSTADRVTSHETGFHYGENIYHACRVHPGIEALRTFNRHFQSRELTRSELVVFLASMSAFNRHTIGGIAILAGRLSDQVLPRLPDTGHEIGAYVLDAAVDEYGLRETVTHVELGRKFAGYLGISSAELDCRINVTPAALELGDALFSWYRASPTAFALGVHAASEISSMEEFTEWHDAFLKFRGYRLSKDVPQFEYMSAHHTHEPQHVEAVRMCVSRYLGVFPAEGECVREGTQAYLSLYQRMFQELDARIFG
jgi:pyrroloquinoline quinone (PQQ) biosynthesis protein C